MYKKPVIIFEGIEGSGKTHHISKVADYLKKKNIDFIKIREPGGNLGSEKIRKLILSKKSKFNIITDLLLYLAARNENIQLLKKYYKKKVILIDRFIDISKKVTTNKKLRTLQELRYLINFLYEKKIELFLGIDIQKHNQNFAGQAYLNQRPQ